MVNPAGEAHRDAWGHTRFLMETIGGRASCSAEERQAAEYTVEQLTQFGCQTVRLESFRGSRSTYRPFAVAFGVAILGSLAALFSDVRWVWLAAALLSGLGVWGMWAEMDIAPSWVRIFTPRGDSQNVVEVIQPRQEVRQSVAICAHLDTHRAPIFYSTPRWQRVFSLVLLMTFLSMVTGVLGYGLAAGFSLGLLRWLGFVALPVQLFALAMCVSAEFAPLSPGANDNTASVGVTLELARCLAAEPLNSTAVWCVFTGCEEVGAYGMSAFLDRHASELGSQVLFIIPEQIGAGQLTLVTAEGLVKKRSIPREILNLGQQAAAILPGLELDEQVGGAYSDALPAIKRGLNALVITNNPAAIGEVSHWHQMSDTLEHIYPQNLLQAQALILEIVRQIDNQENPRISSEVDVQI